MTQLQVHQNSLQRWLQIVPASQIGAWFFSKFLHALDKQLMRITNDKISVPQLVSGLPCVRLTSIGAKSGMKRVTPTIGVPDGENIAIVCSNWGQPHHPAWYYNLKQNPEALLEFATQSGPYLANEVTDEAEYNRLWQKACEVYIGYEKYKSRTGGRKIPILLLTPQ